MTDPEEVASTLRNRAAELSAEMAGRHLDRYPDLRERYGPLAAARCREDGRFHLEHLAAAVATERPKVFDEYLAWVASLLTAHGIDHEELHRHLEVALEVIAEDLGADAAAVLQPIVERSLAVLSRLPPEPESFVDESTSMGGLASRFLDLLLAGDRRAATALILEADDSGTTIETLYLEVFEPCLREVGRLWQLGRATVAQEHFVTAATQLAMAQLYPRTFGTTRIGRRIVVSSVGGELHDVGGRMVADLFEAGGWDTDFLGANTPSRDVARMAVERDVDVVAVSATLPTHISALQEMVDAVRADHSSYVLVGGRPFNQVPDLWWSVGADGTASDARHAVRVATELLTNV